MTLSDRKREQIRADLAPALIDGEQILATTTCLAEVRRIGQTTMRRATLAITDRRVLVFSKKLGGYDVSDFAYGLLTGVDHKKGMFAGHIDLRAAGDAAHLSQVDKTDVERIAQLIRDRMAVSHQPAPPATATEAASVADELTKLAGLRDSGVLSAAEFEAQKARLLG